MITVVLALIGAMLGTVFISYFFNAVNLRSKDEEYYEENCDD
jgi:hypothetical protein